MNTWILWLYIEKKKILGISNKKQIHCSQVAKLGILSSLTGNRHVFRFNISWSKYWGCLNIVWWCTEEEVLFQTFVIQMSTGFFGHPPNPNDTDGRRLCVWGLCVCVFFFFLMKISIAQCNGFKIMTPPAFRSFYYSIFFCHLALNLLEKFKLAGDPVRLAAWRHFYLLSFSIRD